IECHRCPWGAQPRCDREWRELETLTERLGVRRRALEQFRNAYWQEFLNVVEVLEQFGAVRDRRLEPRGRLIAGLRHDNEPFGGHEGDLIRAMRRLIDLLRQLAESPEVPPETARLLAQVARIIDRSIVLESALI